MGVQVDARLDEGARELRRIVGGTLERELLRREMRLDVGGTGRHDG